MQTQLCSGRAVSNTRLASCSDGILARSTGEYWRAAPVRYWPDTRQDPPARGTQRDTRRDPLTGCSGGILGGICWRAALARQDLLASRSGRVLGVIHWPAALAGYWAGSTGEQLWRDTGRDPLASRSGRILAGYSAGSTGQQLWRDTGRDPLASSSGGTGLHWRAALAGYSAGSTGELLWRDTGWAHRKRGFQHKI